MKIIKDFENNLPQKNTTNSYFIDNKLIRGVKFEDDRISGLLYFWEEEDGIITANRSESVYEFNQDIEVTEYPKVLITSIQDIQVNDRLLIDGEILTVTATDTEQSITTLSLSNNKAIQVKMCTQLFVLKEAVKEEKERQEKINSIIDNSKTLKEAKAYLQNHPEYSLKCDSIIDNSKTLKETVQIEKKNESLEITSEDLFEKMLEQEVTLNDDIFKIEKSEEQFILTVKGIKSSDNEAYQMTLTKEECLKEMYKLINYLTYKQAVIDLFNNDEPKAQETVTETSTVQYSQPAIEFKIGDKILIGEETLTIKGIKDVTQSIWFDLENGQAKMYRKHTSLTGIKEVTITPKENNLDNVRDNITYKLLNLEMENERSHQLIMLLQNIAQDLVWDDFEQQLKYLTKNSEILLNNKYTLKYTFVYESEMYEVSLDYDEIPLLLPSSILKPKHLVVLIFILNNDKIFPLSILDKLLELQNNQYCSNYWYLHQINLTEHLNLIFKWEKELKKTKVYQSNKKDLELGIFNKFHTIGNINFPNILCNHHFVFVYLKKDNGFDIKLLKETLEFYKDTVSPDDFILLYTIYCTEYDIELNSILKQIVNSN